MDSEPAGILLLERRIERGELARLFGDMIQYVVDVERTTTRGGGATDASSSRR